MTSRHTASHQLYVVMCGISVKKLSLNLNVIVKCGKTHLRVIQVWKVVGCNVRKKRRYLKSNEKIVKSFHPDEIQLCFTD